MAMLCSLASCGKLESHIEGDYQNSHNDAEEKNDGTSLISDTTVAWDNLYEDNYKIVSEKKSYTFTGDYEYYKLRDAIGNLDYNEVNNLEACIAIVTLMKVGETDEDISNYTPVYLKIDKVLEHNGVGCEFKEGTEIVCEDDVRWCLLDDGTYRIEVETPEPIPLAEVGARYVVQFTKIKERVLHNCISLPFDADKYYVDTVAVGDYDHNLISAQTMWYYDINSMYYYQYWEEHPEDLEWNKELGNDVYNKESIYFWDNR